MTSHYTITSQILQDILDITQLLTRLEFVQERQLHLRKESRIRSIYSSLAIESNSLSLEQVTDVINGKRVFGAPKDIREVQNAYDAYEMVFQMNPYVVEDFLRAHALMTKELITESGAFRSKDVGVYDSAGQVVHIGARPQFVGKLIADLFDWARQTDVPDIIKSCIVHFEIEMIHPFSDGNGRMGRVWQNLILSKWYPIFEWIPIETIIYEHQQAYYDALSQSNKDNSATVFIEFMLAVILETLQEYGLQEEPGITLQVSSKVSLFFEAIKPYLLSEGAITTQQASQLTGKSLATARRNLAQLVAEGLLVATGQNRNRKYGLAKKNN